MSWVVQARAEHADSVGAAQPESGSRIGSANLLEFHHGRDASRAQAAA